MPTATTLSGWKLLNFGPATTTFTAPKSCATAFKTGIAASSEPSAIRWDAQCTWTPPADCNPVGTRVQSLIASAGGPDIKIVDQFFIVYQSPGIICPSGQLTVGAAEKVNPTSTSVSGAFNVSDAVPTDDANPWLPGQLQVVLGALDAGETAILCCPSNYTPIDGACISAIPTASYTPSVGCRREGSEDDYGTVNGTWIAGGGKTVTGELLVPTGTAPLSTVTTTFAKDEMVSSIGVAIEGMGILIHKSSDLAKAPAPTSATTTGGAGATPSATTSTKTGAASRKSLGWSARSVLVVFCCILFVSGRI